MVATLTPLLSTLFLAAEEGAEAHAAEASLTSGWLVEAAWLIVVVPMVMTFVIAFVGKQLPGKGWELAWGTMLFVAVYGTVLFLANAADGVLYEGTIEVARIGDFAIEWGWTVDGLSIMMYFLVGVVGFLVFTYSLGYMQGDARFTWFFVSFTLFAGGMLVLVSAPNLLQLIVGWELVGLASYLLIGHYWEDYENVDAANKAFMTNKVGDAALFIGAIIMAVSVGSFRFSDALDVVASGDAGSQLSRYGFWVGLMLFIGAMGKSAQFPLHVWLPDAMAGPTPVSALMHAATMVTAGVYLLGRVFPLYLDPTGVFAGEVRTVIVIIGGITLFFMGLLAVVQEDIKKVLAYSTVSQLGYMTAAMGAGAYTAGLFHLFTHAFFKALLFLAAGSVIHAVHSNDMSDMGGLRKFMPVTFWTFIVGTLALIGIMPLAGFWSKDEIIGSLRVAADEGGEGAAWFVLALAVAGSLVTAFYMGRTVFLTFFGSYRGHGHPHESPRSMTVPLIGLAAFSAVAGLVNMPGIYTGFTDWLATRAHVMGDHHAEAIDWALVFVVTAFVLTGVAIAWRVFYPDRATQLERDRFSIPVLYPLLRHKYYIDDLYLTGIMRPTMGPVAAAVLWIDERVVDNVANGLGVAARLVARRVVDVDQYGVDGVYHAASAATGGVGGVLRLAFTGRVQQYAAFSFLGVVVIAALFLIF
jgi:NADH-quinone oxidoreductase subunit L